jgi:pilus assembly protein CpaB
MDRRKILLILSAMIAALGTLLVFLYVQGAEGRAKENFESVEVLVATQSIAQGESLEDASGKFEKRELPKDAVLPNAQTSLDSLEGLVALTPIYAGEQIISAKWGGSVDVTSSVLAIPKGKVAASVNLTDPARVAGFVNPGSTVAILVSIESGQYTQTLLPRVTVLGVGATSTITSTKTTEEGASETEQIAATLMTVALTQKEAEKILWASTYGQLSFALVNEESKLTKTGPVNEPNLFE